MRIAMMGAGALGSLFGGRLAAAGDDVVLVGRGAHLTAMRESGLRIEAADRVTRVARIAATDDPAKVGRVDAVLFLVKRYDTDVAARAMAPMLGPETVVVTVQNGIEADRDVAAACGVPVFPGAAYVPATITSPGVVMSEIAVPRVAFGDPAGQARPALSELARNLNAAGVEANVVDDIGAQIFKKFTFLSTLAAITRLPIGAIRVDRHAERLYRDALAEGVAVSRAIRPELPEDLVDRQMEAMHGLPGGVHASMLDDLLGGKRLELDYLSGTIVKLGREHGIPTPVHATAFAALHPFIDGAPAS